MHLCAEVLGRISAKLLLEELIPPITPFLPFLFPALRPSFSISPFSYMYLNLLSSSPFFLLKKEQKRKRGSLEANQYLRE